jgi:hypothetical protein
MNCADVYRIFFNPGEVTEIRAIGCKGKGKAWEDWARDIVFGYFDNAEAFGQAAEALDETKPKGIYFVLNPVMPALLARAQNRLKAADGKTPQTSDGDVLCLRWLYIDIDPKRPSGISATLEELDQAVKLRNKISKWLKEERGAGQPIVACSGNGAHLLIRLEDLPNIQENVERLKHALETINAKFGNKSVDIDLKVFNPARICKLYGTWARKGDHTDLRPHRMSFIEPKLESVLKGQNHDSPHP